MMVRMPYIGGILSKNDYQFKGGGTKPVVKRWMYRLAHELEALRGSRGVFQVTVRGKFRDERRPDIQNLFEVVSDAVQMGLGIDDKHFVLADGGYSTGHLNPELVVTVEAVEEEAQGGTQRRSTTIGRS